MTGTAVRRVSFVLVGQIEGLLLSDSLVAFPLLLYLEVLLQHLLHVFERLFDLEQHVFILDVRVNAFAREDVVLVPQVVKQQACCCTRHQVALLAVPIAHAYYLDATIHDREHAVFVFDDRSLLIIELVFDNEVIDSSFLGALETNEVLPGLVEQRQVFQTEVTL